MPIQECTLGGKPGFKYGQAGTCYTHDGTPAGRADAKKKAVKQAIAISGGKTPRDLEAAEPALVAEAVREYATLETVDLDGVEILAVGGPIKGIGSPPEGDFYTPADLAAIAAANRELADELQPPSRIGHERNGAMPAVGHLANIRVSDNGEKLLTDIKQMPRKFADVVKARGYRSRSVELGRVTSQRTGKTHDWAVTGLAWLGAKLPAVRTLDDVAALYEEGDGIERRFVQVDEQELADLDIERLLEGVYDLAAANTTLIAQKIEGHADTRPLMPESKYTDDQRRKFADATGLEAEKVTDELLANAGLPETEQPRPEPPKTNDDATRSLEEALATARSAEARSRKLEEELAGERKRTFVDGVLRSGRAEPGQRPEVEALYDADPEKARKFFETVKPDDDLAREYGDDSDGGGSTEEQDRAFEEAYVADAASRLGVPKEAIV